MRTILGQLCIGVLFYGIMYLSGAPQWASLQTGILCALIIENIMVNKK
jgi:hypothetical protein